jgi:type I restriction enzyme S subunit
VTGSIGIPALVNVDHQFVFQRHIAILKPNRQKLSAKYLYRLLAAPQIMEQTLAVATGTAQLTIPLAGLREFELPLPTLDQQIEISRRIETAFAWIDRLASEAKSARKLIDHLDRAVLAKAFSGQLVPQDPNEEPAGVLLDRILSERAAAGPRSHQKKVRRTR